MRLEVGHRLHGEEAPEELLRPRSGPSGAVRRAVVVRVSVVQAVAQWEELAVLGAPPGPVMNRRGTAKSNSLEA